MYDLVIIPLISQPCTHIHDMFLRNSRVLINAEAVHLMRTHPGLAVGECVEWTAADERTPLYCILYMLNVTMASKEVSFYVCSRGQPSHK